MQWHWGEGQGELTLVSAEEAEMAAARAAISELRVAGTWGSRTGERLAAGLASGRLEWKVVKSLSSWCDSGVSYSAGVEPARRVSVALFGGVLPRLTTYRDQVVREAEARQRFGLFLREVAGSVPAVTGRAEIEQRTSGAPEPGGFTIFGQGGEPIRSEREWLRYAPPAGGEKQWKDGYSARELARRWLSGGIPSEIRALLESRSEFVGFRPERAHAETETPLDGFEGNTRNQDLVVIGRVGGDVVTLDIEGKAAESFGDTIETRLKAAVAYRQTNSRSRAEERIRWLSAEVLGAGPEEAGELRYQLLHSVAAAVIRARQEGAKRVAFIVHEFCVGEAKAEARRRNQQDLEAFVRRLGGDPAGLADGLVGPLVLPGGERVPSGAELYIGKARCRL